MLLAVTQCISQSKWLLFRTTPHRLIDFNTIDEASRGPYGSLSLLTQANGRSHLAYAGAIIIVTSLAVEPFTQQVLTYPLSPVEAVGGLAATVPIMQEWNSIGNDATDNPLFDFNGR